MSDIENDPLEPIPVDPPDTQGGGTEADLNPDLSGADALAVDPPETHGGGG
jgi:hypothetical protein